MNSSICSRRVLTHLETLESESIHILREVAAECRNPALLFSGGKDSLVLLRLAEKAFRPARFPFPLMHIDTEHNFPEVIEFRDHRAAELGEQLIVRSSAIQLAQGRVVLKSPDESRNVHQSVTLLDAIEELQLDACIGGARRDEEKARAKERIFSFRDEFGQWDPKNQRPELWHLYNTRVRPGENIRVFPISNWTELDVWSYIAKERLDVPSIYYAHRRAGDAPPGRPDAGVRTGAAEARRKSGNDLGPLSHGGRYDLHLPGGVDRDDGRSHHRRNRGDADHRARRYPDGRSDLRRVDGAAEKRRVLLTGSF